MVQHGKPWENDALTLHFMRFLRMLYGTNCEEAKKSRRGRSGSRHSNTDKVPGEDVANASGL